MKKNLFTALSFAFLSGSMFAQLPVSTTPENKSVLLEEFTGIHCGYCPDGHVKANQIHDADPTHVVLVNIHSGSFANAGTGEIDFKTTDGTAIDQMPGQGISGYPAGTINRRVFSSPQTAGGMAQSRSAWASRAATVKSEPAYCNVALQATIEPQTRVLTIDVEVYYTANGATATNSLNVFLLENWIHGSQSNYGTPFWNLSNYNADGSYNHNHVLRKAITPTFGMTIPNTTSATLYTTTLTYTVPATYGATGKSTVPKFENFEVVAFITETDRNVINAAEGPVYISKDVKAVSAVLPAMTCATSFSAVVTVSNTGMSTFNSLTVTPSLDAVAQTPTTWTGTLLPGATTTIALNNISATTSGGHAFTYVVSGDNYTLNNSGTGKVYLATNYQTTPVAEGFALGTFPPAKWNVVNADNGPAWSRNTTAGSYSVWPLQSIKYDFYNNTVIGDKDELYLPPMDLSGAADPTLDFDLAYAQRMSTSDDKLEVFASDDCGDTWVSFYSNSGVSLSTSISEAPYDLTYDLLSSDKWRTENVTLPGFNKSDVLVKFVTTSDNGSSLYLDNINLAQKNPTGINRVTGTLSGAVVYPNPATAIANIRIQANTSGNGNISVVNTLGQLVMKKDVSIVAGNNVVEMDTRSLATGVYHVIIQSENSTVAKKLTISK